MSCAPEVIEQLNPDRNEYVWNEAHPFMRYELDMAQKDERELMKRLGKMAKARGDVLLEDDDAALLALKKNWSVTERINCWRRRSPSSSERNCASVMPLFCSTLIMVL